MNAYLKQGKQSKKEYTPAEEAAYEYRKTRRAAKETAGKKKCPPFLRHKNLKYYFSE